MRRFSFLAAVTLALASPALAGAGSFTLVNGAGVALTDMSIRRTGSQDWKALGASPSAGARQSVAFSDPDCAFDIRATLANDGSVVWTGVNLCEVKSVILNRSAGGQLWVDYD